MTEFKQIVGRGTRVHEDTRKFYFTLIDFRGATSHFADPDFDGEPVQIYEPGEDDPIDAARRRASRPTRTSDADARRRRARTRPSSIEPGLPLPPGEPAADEDLRRWRRRHASSPSASNTSTRTASSSPNPCAISPRTR